MKTGLASKKMKRKKIGLALSGGSVRGFAHVGVLHVFAAEGIPIDFISGTSSGSIIAALYANELSVQHSFGISLNINWKSFAAIHLSRKGMINGSTIERFIQSRIPHDSFDELKIPLAVTTTDLLSGEEIVHTSGSLSRAIRMSCSFPGIYVPISEGERVYVDGGLTANVPIEPLRQMGADIIIAVDVIPRVPLTVMPKNVLTVADRALDILLKRQTLANCAGIDLLIEPVTEYVNSFEMGRKADLVRMGAYAAKDAIPQIKQLLRS